MLAVCDAERSMIGANGKGNLVVDGRIMEKVTTTSDSDDVWLRN